MQWLVDHRDFIVALAALAVAAGEAIYAISHFTKLNAKLRESTELLSSVRNLLNTKPIGEFPDFITSVGRLISTAQEEIRIVCAFPAFGCFSNYEAFLTYKQAIERKAAITSLICLDASRRIIRHQRQFPDGITNPPTHVRDFSKKLRELRERERSTISGDEDFRDAMFKQDERMISDIKVKEFRISDQDFPLHIWIVDRKRAIFSFPRFTDRDKELAFETDHHDLVSSLLHAWTTYASASTETSDLAVKSQPIVPRDTQQAAAKDSA